MRRRDLMAMSVGSLLAAAFGARTFGQVLAATSVAKDTESARRYNLERKFVATSFGRIAYFERGAGPVAVFLHGFPLSSFQWRGVIERLSAERRCVAPDAMGLGFTQVVLGQSLKPGAQADMLEAFLDRLAIGPVDLIANDSGGAIAQLFLSRHPQRVRSLLLTNCDVEIDSPPVRLLPIIGWARAGLYPETYLEPWLNDKDVARSQTSGLSGMCYSDPTHPTDAAIEQYLRPLVSSAKRRAQVNQYLLGLESNPLKGLEPVLRTLRVPTRIVWGMADTFFTSADADYLARILPGVTGIRQIANGKLFFPEEYPEVIAEEARLLWGTMRPH